MTNQLVREHSRAVRRDEVERDVFKHAAVARLHTPFDVVLNLANRGHVTVLTRDKRTVAQFGVQTDQGHLADGRIGQSVSELGCKIRLPGMVEIVNQPAQVRTRPSGKLSGVPF